MMKFIRRVLSKLKEFLRWLWGIKPQSLPQTCQCLDCQCSEEATETNNPQYHKPPIEAEQYDVHFESDEYPYQGIGFENI